MKIFYFSFLISISVAVMWGIQSNKPETKLVNIENGISILKIIDFKDIDGYLYQEYNSVYFDPKSIYKSYILDLPNDKIIFEECNLSRFNEGERNRYHQFLRFKFILQTDKALYLFHKTKFEDFYFWKFKFSRNIHGNFHYDFWDCSKTNSLKTEYFLPNYIENKGKKNNFNEYIKKMEIHQENYTLGIGYKNLILIGFLLNLLLFIFLIIYLNNYYLMLPIFIAFNLFLCYLIRFNEGH
ncbi:hypothetical protein [Leptospira levettii]|uniref:hypothetical protein n=1 Tax=Leptospira levettii TaxID=2023178 RepID=UPI000C2A82D0|nr:hypothetical protein [Leptospira levettii]MCW7475453.1 hypothetical protein [Leptospira levettii]PJZ88732.1 hypothetical protein CH368_10335 [Leptospira levettii]